MRELIHVIRTDPALAMHSVGADAHDLIGAIDGVISLELVEEDEQSAILLGVWTGDPFPAIDEALPRAGLRRVEPVIDVEEKASDPDESCPDSGLIPEPA